MIKDFAWAQYSLFLAVRMHDDLFDRQADWKNLIYTGDSLIIEAEKIFMKYFAASDLFWKNYYLLVETTINSILKVDRLQQSDRTSLTVLYDNYAGVCSIFKIGALAVCVKMNLMRRYKKISKAADNLAVIGHLIDDFYDIDEDLMNKRYNSAYHLVRKNRHNVKKGVTKENIGLYIDELNRQIKSCALALRGLNITELDEYLELFKKYSYDIDKRGCSMLDLGTIM